MLVFSTSVVRTVLNCISMQYSNVLMVQYFFWQRLEVTVLWNWASVLPEGMSHASCKRHPLRSRLVQDFVDLFRVSSQFHFAPGPPVHVFHDLKSFQCWFIFNMNHWSNDGKNIENHVWILSFWLSFSTGRSNSLKHAAEEHPGKHTFRQKICLSIIQSAHPCCCHNRMPQIMSMVWTWQSSRLKMLLSF